MEGVRFTCQPGCTRCCDMEGYVYITEQDLKNAARHVGLTAAEFEKKYVYRTRHLLRFRKPRDRQCHFLLQGGCSIHESKPTQCRLFPFWPELLETRQAWDKTGRRCPGIGKGRLIQIGTAHETASEMKLAYPTMYED